MYKPGIKRSMGLRITPPCYLLILKNVWALIIIASKEIMNNNNLFIRHIMPFRYLLRDYNYGAVKRIYKNFN